MGNKLVIALLVVSASLAWGGGPKTETVTYLDGNLTGITVNSGGTLVFTNDTQMELRTGLATVAIPYANVSRAKLGAIREQGSSDPLYKVWSLHKRILKSQMQKLSVDFTNLDGEEKKLTVELEKGAAAQAVKTIHWANNDADTGIQSEQAAAPNPNAWWGDNVWKTKRNASTWPAQGAPSTK